MGAGFGFFGIVFQVLASYSKMDILKPIVLIGTFALAMAFAGNDLVNFIGVPLAGLNAYKIASASAEPLHTAMDALQKPMQTNTFLFPVIPFSCNFTGLIFGMQDDDPAGHEQDMGRWQ